MPPGGASGWQLDQRRVALLVHDVQQYYLQRAECDAAFLENCSRLVTHFRQAGCSIYYSKSLPVTVAERGLLHDFWGPGMSDAPVEARIPQSVQPRPDDVVVVKSRYSAFYATQLFAEMQRSRTQQLVLVGLYAEVGVLATAVDAFVRDLQVFIPADAVASRQSGWRESALRHASNMCAQVTTTPRVLAALSRRDMRWNNV